MSRTRACATTGFSLPLDAQAACFLSHLLRDWRVEVDLNAKGCKDAREWESRFLRPVFRATMATGE